MDAGYRFEDKKYRQILRKSNKAVIERIHRIEQEQKEYREYMEGWVHEVKTPLTTIGLICENKKDDQTRRILTELAKLDNDVETMLFYARADQVYQDYLIQPISLHERILYVIAKNKQLFIQNQMQIEITFSEAVVRSDPKWVEFIINQIVLNSIKYKRENEAKITFSIETQNAGKSLIIRDNGIGILEEEQKRVFDKGFTGTNGRNHEKSTGIGLYLCKRLCDKLGIGICIRSVLMHETEVILTFPDIAKDMPYLSKL
ncbi:MAG: HAMP domain-containing histidine kinase [Lachnospiraceae bacterium]|nr:HAMP domain-containing histidine kinase [Lachnospiraceae bacterium]